MMGVTVIERDLAVHKHIVVQLVPITHLNKATTTTAIATIETIHVIRDMTTMTTIGQT